MSRFLAVASVMLLGYAACADSAASYEQMENQYKACFADYSGKYFGDGKNAWVIDQMTGMYINANTKEEMRILRNYCESVLSCPPREYMVQACHPSDYREPGGD